MTTTADLCYLTLHELSTRIRSREVSPVEATEASLERIERLNPMLNSFITVTADQALEAARAAEREIASGSYRGPLHGVPVGVKDLCQTKGVRTTAASKFLSDWLPDEDAAVVERLREAGAVIVGKTHLHEWALGATGVNPHYGPARNPWDPSRITGGSSSGSGNGVAAGLCFAAIGSDTGGSIRMPAALCGITGIKPTYGRVSLRGVVPLATSLDHVGPMARTVRDCAIVLEAIAGHDPADPDSAAAPVEGWAAQLDGGIAGLRIGVPRAAFDDAEPEITARVREAIGTLGGLGAVVKELDLPAIQAYWPPAAAVLLAEAAAYHRERVEQRPQDFGDDVLLRLTSGLDIRAVDYVAAWQAMREARRTCDDALLAEVDLLAMPTTIRTAVPIDSVSSDDPTLGLTGLPRRSTSPPSRRCRCPAA